ncbi:arginine deiminase-related protein [Legionella impletisoli]|uniref:Amidinotransferase n=1 Tax=Legionella impletisoli TaxID=343510 RepID=A0A917JYM2_9GAMM|nr:arginine deiminase-related protein [Legionella impletisoli]GGI90147.1 hypothetical protein GCM10007966_18650 [Legionella impletisoli]
MRSTLAFSSPPTTAHVVMVPPVGFEYNHQTAKTNAYQQKIHDENYHENVLREFNNMVQRLEEHDVMVMLLNENAQFADAVFPNNWFSTHIDEEGKLTVLLYPMLTENRKKEVNPEGLKALLEKHQIQINQFVDLRIEQEGVLESTGSMIFDREHKLIYASLSPRTDKALVNTVAKLLNYQTIIFTSYGVNSQPIYHTNVMMGLTKHCAVVCLECIHDPKERENVRQSLMTTHKNIIAITSEQVSHLCGNIIELTNRQNQSLLILSQQAYDHFTPEQRSLLKQYSTLLPMELTTIETIGGGSARCMIAEIFPPLV